MPRKRMTWKQAEQDKTASPPPQMPAVDRTEGPSSPAYHPDPDPDKYKSGDTSSWAEDPHPGIEESPPPAMPGNLTTEKLTHPGTSDFQKDPQTPAEAAERGGGGAAKQASLKEMAQARATLCVRIASALMKDADAGAVENKALELMDLDDAQLQATAQTLKLVAGEEPEEEVEEEDEVAIEAGKKANVEVVARVEKLEGAVGKLVKAMSHFFGMEDDENMSDKELMAYLTAEDMDGDGIDQSKNDYPQGYDVEKLSGEDEEAPPPAPPAEEEEAVSEEETMLRAMLEEMDEEMAITASDKTAQDEEEKKEDEEEKKEASDDKEASESKEGSAVEDATEPLAKGPSIQSGEGGNVTPEKYPPTPVVAQSDGSDKTADPSGAKAASDETPANPADNDIDITAGQDPMGLMEEGTAKEASPDDELMQLYSDLDLPKTAQDEEAPEEVVEEEEEVEKEAAEKTAQDEEEKEEEGEKEAAKKAAEEPDLKPQPKVASQGAQKLGNVAGMSKEAATEITELQKMWESAPDVSKVFGVPSSS